MTDQEQIAALQQQVKELQARIAELTAPHPLALVIKPFMGDDGKWRIRGVGMNHEKSVQGTQGYHNKSNAVRAANRLKALMKDGAAIVQEEPRKPRSKT